MKKLWWRIAGIVSLFLGVIGIVLPILPTTPFLLLAAFCFDRSSPALHNWLVNHKLFGPPINNWQAYGAVSRLAKISAIAVMVFMISIGAYFGLAWWVLAIQGTIFSAVSVFLLTRPTPPETPTRVKRELP